MRLTSLEIQGFKSFADRTKLRFDHNITGIVGPNGCGKSNVIDAIRWVLGEQKTRNLRSEKMEDVIFNGSDARKRANLAEVSITFENTRNLLPTEFSTITITRRLYRDGESEYLLNSVPCRLKDITNLLLDTGIGSDSYAIIELGMVDDLLKDKNNARRQLFEEAAGISRYKIRKKETLTRLDETEQSLARVEDIVFEIERNLKTLEKQAKRAEQYFALKGEYKEASARYACLMLHNHRQEAATLAEQIQTLRDNLTGTDARIAKHEARIQDLQRQLTDSETKLADEQKGLLAHNDAIRKLENERLVRSEKLNYLRQRQDQIAKQIDNAGTDRERLSQRLAELEVQIDNANATYDELEYRLGELETEREELQQAVTNRRRKVEELQQKVRSTERNLQERIREQDLRKVRIQTLEREQGHSVAERDRRAQAGAQLRQEAESLATLQAEAQQRRDELARAKQTLEAEIETLREELQQLKDKHLGTQRRLDAARNEHDLTKSLVENLEGFPDSVKFLKKRSNEWAKEPALLSDLFSTDDAYKVAIESYLEPYMNYLVVQNRREAVEAVRLLGRSAKGRANFFILDDIAAQAPTDATPLPSGFDAAPHGLRLVLDLIDYQPRFAPLARLLFGQVYLTATEQLTALADELRHLAPGLTLLHQNGEVQLRPHSVGGGSVGLFTGKRIGRAKNLERLADDIAALTKQIDAERADMQAISQAIQDRLPQVPTRELQTAERELQTLSQQLSAARAKADESQNVLSGLDHRAQSVARDIEALQAEWNRYQPALDAQTDELHTLQDQLVQDERLLLQRTEAYTTTNNAFNEQNIKFLNQKNLVANLKKDFISIREQIQGSAQSRERLQQELAQLQRETEELVGRENEGADELVALYDRRKAWQERIEVQEETVRQIRSGIQQNENFIRKERTDKDRLQTEADTLRERLATLQLQQAGVAERLSVEFGLNIDELRPDELFGPDAVLSQQPVAKLEQTVLALRDRLNKFGEVNPTAIEAYNELRQRSDFINTQRADLVAAKKDLLDTIAELDTTARTRFMEAFTTIRDHFIRVFRTLFTQDDLCDLVLLNADDPLESPIDIIARPKGKRPLSINQLSGGEKTLTAISLLFAIYLLKPAPFCIFDEVDAPLDDANIDKFNNIIREFSRDSQFLLVTHNKRTMTHTNVMYGVTMAQTGISRILPVDLDALGLN